MDEIGAKVSGFWKRVFSPMLRAIVTTNDSPRQFAAGAALGTFIAFTPTLGVQTASGFLLATLFRVSRIPCVIMVYITNPLTAIPVYGACYWVGARLCRLGGIRVASRETFNAFKDAIFHGAELGIVEYVGHVAKTFTKFGLALAVPLWLGGLLFGVVGAAICYAVVLRLAEGHRVLRTQKQARRLQRKVREDEGTQVEGSPAVFMPTSVPDAEEGTAKEETPREPDAVQPGRAGDHRVDPPPEGHAAGGHRRSG